MDATVVVILKYRSKIMPKDRMAENLIVNSSHPVNLMLCNWAMKMTATASYSAVPSCGKYSNSKWAFNVQQTIVIVAPSGSTNRVTRRSMRRFCSRARKVTGKVAPLKGTK
jgi:hypothetical protein